MESNQQPRAGERPVQTGSTGSSRTKGFPQLMERLASEVVSMEDPKEYAIESVTAVSIQREPLYSTAPWVLKETYVFVLIAVAVGMWVGLHRTGLAPVHQLVLTVLAVLAAHAAMCQAYAVYMVAKLRKQIADFTAHFNKMARPQGN